MDVSGILEKACSTPAGTARANFALQDLQKVAAMYAHEPTRPQAVTTLEKWAAGGNELRKGLATAWLARARSLLVPATKAIAGANRAVGHVGTAVNTMATKAGSIGAAAGEKLARSPLNSSRMAAAQHAGGLEAQARMAERLKPGGMRPHEVPQAQREIHGTHDLTPGSGAGTPLPPRAGTASVHADALAGAYRAGAASAGEAHAGAAARLGRVAAKHGFRAGLAIGTTGAAGAGIHAALSEKQHEERVNAGKHSHQRGAA